MNRVYDFGFRHGFATADNSAPFRIVFDLFAKFFRREIFKPVVVQDFYGVFGFFDLILFFDFVRNIFADGRRGRKPRRADPRKDKAVSYTHLTLPTT